MLVIEDDVHLADAVRRYLVSAGFRVGLAYDGATGLRAFRDQAPDLVLLDLMMPAMDGWEACRRLRAESSVPIIMLTARASESDRVLGLRSGADDYVVKPFSLRELQARIEAVLRRSALTRTVLARVVFDDGHLRLDREGWQVTRDGRPLSLTATERRLLFALAESAGRVQTTEHLLRTVWGTGCDDQSNYVKLYIWRLRSKLEPDPTRPRYILTDRGLGYRFADPVTAGGKDVSTEA